MIDLHYWPTPNGHKITMMLEECSIEYNLVPVDLTEGEQKSEGFLAISPNGKIPAIVDHSPLSGQGSVQIFESGAILVYLAERSGEFLPEGIGKKFEVLQWLFWQVGGLGPMVGQNGHFTVYTEEKIPYAIDRFRDETGRLYGVLDHLLETRAFVAGDDYSIADMAIYPWVACHDYVHFDIDDLVHLKRWMERIAARPATIRAYDIAKKINPDSGTPPAMTDELRELLFNQTRV